MSMNGAPMSTTADAHLAPLENAARILCALREENPDTLMQAPHPQGLVPYYKRPLWCFAADELLQFNQCAVALKTAAALQEQALTTRVH